MQIKIDKITIYQLSAGSFSTIPQRSNPCEIYNPCWISWLFIKQKTLRNVYKKITLGLEGQISSSL